MAALEFQDVVARRRMVRSFSTEPVPEAALERILANAQRAPSAGFSQGWAFVVLTSPDERRSFWDAIADPDWLAAPDHPGLLRAPVIVVPCADESAYRHRYGEPDKTSRSLTDRWWLVDTSFATMTILLSAVDAGLGALFLGLRGRHAELQAALGIPAGVEPIGAVALGWPDGKDRPSASLARGRRGNVVRRGRW